MRITIVQLGCGSLADAHSGTPIEIRVTHDAIIEIYGANDWSSRKSRIAPSSEFSSTTKGNEGDPGDEYAHWNFSHYRRARRARFIAAYVCFVMAAAVVIWCVVR